MTEMTIALVGNPNSGKTALFNALTGGRQKVGNYPGVTVERKEGYFKTQSGLEIRILDLPGAYSLNARTMDEEVTRDVLLGLQKGERIPDLLVAVADATNLQRNLGFILELKGLGRPMVLALNMIDLARRRGFELELGRFSELLGMPVIPTVAIKSTGISELVSRIEYSLKRDVPEKLYPSQVSKASDPSAIRARFLEADRILKDSGTKLPRPAKWTERLDSILLHPLWGSLILLSVLSFMFQAIFSWAQVPMDALKSLISGVGAVVGNAIGEGPLKSLICDGVIAGVGTVVVFLPQILLLFFFILVFEDSGYMARAAFLMDRLMGKIGLHGRAFIPLLSSYACAIPGIMSTRTIENRRDRLTTILVAPLTTCSARLPVYSLLIGAFIPNRSVYGPIRLQGLVMFGLYILGVVAALGSAALFRSTLFKGPKSSLLMELPTYKWPSFKNLCLGLWERARLFIRRAGTVILTLSILLWFLAAFPKPPIGATEAPINYSYAGRIGHMLEPLVKPLGFNWKIAVALIPGFAAREVMVGALATVYALGEKPDGTSPVLIQKLSEDWGLATGLSLLIWYVLACQCLSTLAVARRETNSWKWPAFMLFYMTVLAYGGSFLVYHIARGLGA